MKFNQDVFKELVNIYTPGGFEDNLESFWENNITSDYYNLLPTNSLVGYLGIPGTLADKIMFSAHSDEISLTITCVNEEGFVYFRGVGGWDRGVLLGQQVSVLSCGMKPINGVISRDPIHVLESGGEAIPKYGNLYIDIGANDKEDALSMISIGDPVILKKDLIELANDNITARGIDNKVSIYCLVELSRKLEQRLKIDQLKYSVWYVASSQEESTMLGASTVAAKLDPTEAIVVDVAITTDTPSPGGSDIENTYLGDIKLGAGPVINIGGILNRKITDQLIQTAEDWGIPYQEVAYAGDGGTEADYITTKGFGVPTGLVSIPCRYMHSTVEVVNKTDIMNTVKLLAEYCCI